MSIVHDAVGSFTSGLAVTRIRQSEVRTRATFIVTINSRYQIWKDDSCHKLVTIYNIYGKKGHRLCRGAMPTFWNSWLMGHPIVRYIHWEDSYAQLSYLHLLRVVNHWTDCTDVGKDIDVLCLDLQKVFDKVPHKQFIHKLEAYGVTGGIIHWIQNFLSNCRQRVCV